MHRNPIAVVVMVIAVAAALPVDAVQLKIATLAPDGSFWMNEARKAADEVADRTDGRVTFRFYPGGTMGAEDAVLRKIRIGQLHGGVILAGTFAPIVTDLQIYQLPLLFSSYDEVDAIRAKYDDGLLDRLAAGGYHSFGFIEGGFAYLFTTKKASTFAELKGRKAWIPDGDPFGRVVVEEAELSPVPLGLSDVLTGLQTGLIDVVSGPPVAAVALQWFTKVKYMIDTPVIYTYGCVVIGDRAWSKISAADQAVIDEVFGEMTRRLDARAREDNRGAREALVAQGVTVVTPDEATAAEWAALAETTSEKLIAELDLTPELVAQMKAEIEVYRSAASQQAAEGE
jgi:TRAP-type C4-dicarboxylate transport system substrate-binding protein